MSKPNLTIAVEPVLDNKLRYLAQAPSFKGGTARSKIIVRLRITNNENKKVQVTHIAFHFPDSSIPKKGMEAVTKAIDPDDRADGESTIDINGWINPHKTATWSNGTVNLDADGTQQAFNQYYHDGPAPKKISIHVQCADFSEVVVTKDFELAPFTSPTTEGAFLFPFSAADIKSGEYFVTRGEHWANGGADGWQIYAHDIFLEGSVNGEPISQYKDGITKPTKNSDFRIWGIPVRAMADGIVVKAQDDTPANTYTGESPPSPAPEANHVWVKHGEVYVYYTHFQQHSIPAELKPTAKNPKPFVRAGDMLGRAGNSGNASGPHTHVHCAYGDMYGALVPFPFRKAWIVDTKKSNPPKNNSQWERLDAEGIPREYVAIWPESTWPGFKVPTAGLTVHGTWDYKFWKSEDFDSFKTKVHAYADAGYPITYASSFLDNGHRRWVGVFRKSTDKSSFWVKDTWSSFADEATRQHSEHGKRTIHVHAFDDGGTTKYFGIAQEGTWANTCWMSDSWDAFKTKVSELAHDGRALVHVSNVALNGSRHWIGISRSAGYTTELFYSTSLTEFESKLDAYKVHGKYCIHMFPYVNGSEHRWAGIVKKMDGPVEMWQNTNWDSFVEVVRYAQQSQQRRLVAVEFPYS
ncbi:Peptidase family M23 [Chryseolinea serpens]|uniref:Peptidase family M23 n=1 Tax=Chryseolinea serpens TaxID=947013 RepID=A0A1M5MBP7_9BACT|nr:M23 family metallopeptidase [Chryseolinea serpens]SHG74665.1 Peptidase family M23 [Chryseolinea serpens]